MSFGQRLRGMELFLTAVSKTMPHCSLDHGAPPQPPAITVRTREPALGCGEVKIVWDGRVQHNLHAYPLAQHLGLVRSMPDKPDT